MIMAHFVTRLVIQFMPQFIAQSGTLFMNQFIGQFVTHLVPQSGTLLTLQ